MRNYSVDALKTSSKGKKVKQHCFSLMTSIYNDQAKLWLSQEEGSFESISKKDIATCNKQKQTGLCSREKFKRKWRSCCSNGDLFKTLTNAHLAIAHHRDKTEHYQGSKLKKSSGRLLATNWRNVIARCKFLVASLYI